MATDLKVFFQAPDPSTVILYYREAQHFLVNTSYTERVKWERKYYI